MKKFENKDITNEDVDLFLKNNSWIFKDYPNQWVAVSIIQEKVIATDKTRGGLHKKISMIVDGHKDFIPNDFIAALPTDVYRNRMLN